LICVSSDDLGWFDVLVPAYPGFPGIAQFAITINSNVCPHFQIPNTLMRESYA